MGLHHILLAASLMSVSAAAVATQTNLAVSVNNAGDFADRSCQSARISGDGRYAVFASRAHNLAPGLSGGFDFVFRRDLETQTTEVVSVRLDGTPADKSLTPDISSDGRYVAFISLQSDLVVGDTNGEVDVFVRDMVTGVTELISVDSNGVQGDQASSQPRISGNGRFVTFETYSRFDARDLNNNPDIYRRDRLTGALEYVSVTQAGEGADSWNTDSDISESGRFVVFRSRARNFGGSTPDGVHIYRKDMQTGELLQVDRGPNPSTVPLGSAWPAISANGQVVAFVSDLWNLVPGDNDFQSDLHTYDVTTDTIEKLNLHPSGSLATGNFSSTLGISFRGRFVAFSTNSDNLLPGPGSFAEEVFLHDRLTSTNERVSLGAQGGVVNNYARYPHMDHDGRIVTFLSIATNLTPGGNSFAPQVYARDMRGDLGTIYCAGVPNSTGDVGGISALGFEQVNRNEVTLHSNSLPPAVLTFFIVSLTPGFTVQPGGSAGNLCLGGSIGRYIRPGEVLDSGVTRSASLQISLTDVPQPSGPVVIQPGTAVYFQGWYRDAVAGIATSNFTAGLRIDFQ